MPAPPSVPPQDTPTEIIARERGAIWLAALIVFEIALLICLVSPLIFLLSTRSERQDREAQVTYDYRDVSR